MTDKRVTALTHLLAEPDFAEIRPLEQSLHAYSLQTLHRARMLNSAGITANSLWLGRGTTSEFADFLRSMGWIGAYDASLANVLVSHQIAGDALLSHADPDQLAQYGPEIDRMTKVYCFAASELHAGSDLKRIGTTATYRHADRSLVLHTPEPADSKVWIGNSLYTGDVAMVLSRVVVDGRDEGHHWLRVPLRSEGRLIDGVHVRGAEPKGGVEANQTGIITFDRCVLPVSAMMSRWARIDEQGRYHSPLKRYRRFDECLATFTHERLFPTAGAGMAQRLACAVTVRFADLKKAFGGPLISHPHYRMRLRTAAGRATAAKHALEALTAVAVDRHDDRPPSEDRLLHALVACGKTGSTGDARHTLADARELCGGLGYHRLNQISPLQHDYEIAVTFGGDNTVLGYQASRFALREREALAALLDAAIRPHQDASRLLEVMRAVCDQLLADVDRQGPGAASTAWSRAVYQTLALGHWAAHEPTETGQALLRHYAAGCVLEHGVTALRAGALTQEEFLRVAELHEEEGAAPMDAADLLKVLDVPEALITAPIAHADFADRHLAQAVAVPEGRPGPAAVPLRDPA
ncbi:acyl-CoA dehydrogenase family protein [Kitasatospora cathayae]|uniref:Acyl-CoA dehydrogenase family protein n=1 Tax=Kitasatospora cathayae TaxID=3004092 RepID=A0ABY7Q0I4_9ACTN|nr:acyl-CoA dehydrogenase family protein [Kitasatospora sp. HUAS 3-15]WBP86176.1 acyl-CoA dehydrogenase family protein [Kitasatospora sp. HUAS 3-15]